MKLSKSLADGPLATHGIVKHLLSEACSNHLESQMEAESRGLALALSGDEGQEGVRAFLEKRKPVFPGND